LVVGARRVSLSPRAFERRAVQQFRCIPADALVVEARARIVWIDAYAQRALAHGVDAREASARADEMRVGVGFVVAATRQKYLPSREAADRPVENKPHAALPPCDERCRWRRRHGACHIA